MVVTPTRKRLVKMLLDGHYIMSAPSPAGYPSYRVYDGNGNVVWRVRQNTVDRLDRNIHDPQIKLWRIVKPGRIYLNLSSVRQLHGNNFIKRIYKQQTLKK